MIEDEKYMRRALQLAKLGAPNVSPNPMVGAVVVCDGKIIGEGYHRQFGKAHAEVNAINSVKDESLLKRSTIYVTLEPCSHYGKTPPCSELIINKQLRRVVIGTLDPFELVRGRGVKMIEQAGIEVSHGILENECRSLNHKFIEAHTKGRPYIMLKWAETADGFIGGYKGNNTCQVYVSNPITQMLCHKERGRFDAIMVGANTLICDNPSLTQRNFVGKNPIRILLTSHTNLDAESQMFNNEAKTLLFTSNSNVSYPNSETILISEKENEIDEVLKELYSRNISSVIVEGGSSLLQSFVDSNCWDEIRVERGTNVIGSGIKPPVFDGTLTKVEKHGKNIISRFIHC